MQYLGGKTRIAKQISGVIRERATQREIYIEPFLGAGSVAAEAAPFFSNAFLSDACPDLMAMWKAIQHGWVPPEDITELEYHAQKHAPVSALRGFTGYGCSFGGKWFAGYARNARGDNYARQSSHGILRKYRAISQADAWFGCLDYRDAEIPSQSVVYCDPPYRDTTKYAKFREFDSDEFWDIMLRWSENAIVFVSEYSAPSGWIPVWSGKPQASLGLADQTQRVAEHLWVKE